MANYRGGVDLLKLVGAKVVSIDMGGRARNCILIPADFNCISISADGNGNPKSAYINFNEWETNAKFRAACEERNAEKEHYTAPSHEVAVSYNEDFMAAACKAAEKRLRADAEFMKRGLSDEEIKKEARYAVSHRQSIGFVTPMQPKAATPYVGAAAPAPTMGGYQQPTEDPEDDLPF